LPDAPPIFHSHRTVSNQYGNRLLQTKRARSARAHGRHDALGGPFRLILQDEFSKLHGILNADATVAEIASRPRKQLRCRRVMQVDILVVRENELDVAQRVSGSWPLADAPLSSR